VIRIDYRADEDSAYIYLVDRIEPGQVAKTYPCDPAEVGGHINLDFDKTGVLLGIEVLDASRLLTLGSEFRGEPVR
jgi:uncharacterized protein YuzE